MLTLLKRLEAATSRLEDVTIYQEQWAAEQEGPGSGPRTIIPAVMGGDSEDVKAITGGANAEGEKAGGAAVAAAAAAAGSGEAASIEAFDAFVCGSIEPYVDSSLEIDTVLGEQAKVFKEAVLKERDVLKAAAKAAKLDVTDEKFQALIVQPINELIMKVIAIKDDNRSNKYFNLLNAVAEGVAVLGWIVVDKPVSYIPDFKDSSEFWTNRVLKEVKGQEGGEAIGKWVREYLGIFDELKKYAGEYHAEGIAWGTAGEFVLGEEGGETSESSGSSSDDVTSTNTGGATTAPAAASDGAPPAPPPPPADLFAGVVESNVRGEATKPAKSEGGGGGGMSAVFAELNKGEAITSGLKKVDKSEMTHKNPALRKKSVPLPPKKPKKLQTGGVGVTDTDTAGVVVAAPHAAPEQFELVDNKWMVVNVHGGGLRTIDAAMGESVYIGRCTDVVVQIRGKVNAVAVAGCTGVGVVVERAVASVELTGCARCELQVVGCVPVVAADGCTGVSLYLSRTALGVHVYTSGTTALNINVPDERDGDGDGDLVELAVPEQLVTRIERGRLVCEAVVHG